MTSYSVGNKTSLSWKTRIVDLSIRGGRVVTYLAATLKVMDSRHSLGDISELYFLESIQSLAHRDLNGACDIVELTATCNVYTVLIGK